jgi:glycogen operon protein
MDERGHDIDVTGCGNTVDLRHPTVARMVLDSLRYWVEQCHVDGFRFDLAVTLGRGRDDAYHPNNPFLVALRTDPVLSRVKLIAEPWDLGVHGWRTGQFPAPFAEWNDRFRDGVRTFWLHDVRHSVRREPGHGIRELATRLSGSSDLFGDRDRGPIASVNFVAAHDGFSLADTTAYDHKHNLANGEGNRDGQDDSRSWNHGFEGTEAGGADDLVLTARRRSIRNMLATELFASGVPMINAGDEMGRTQGGNNNTYCQDNDISWLDWDLRPWRRDLLETTRFLTRLRADNPVLGQRSAFTERREQEPLIDPLWFAADGQPMDNRAWDDPHTRTLTMLLNGAQVGGLSLLIVFHGGARDAEVTLPALSDGETTYRLVWDSAWERPVPSGDGESTLHAETVDPAKDGPVILTAASTKVYSLSL